MVRYDISTPRGQAQARAFLEACTDSAASICFTCPVGDLNAAMREVIGDAPDFGDDTALVELDQDRWYRVVGLIAAAIGGAAFWWGALILAGVWK